MTFFDWRQAAPNRDGVGVVSATALRVGSPEALAWWQARFETLGVLHGSIEQVAGRHTLRFTDPEGQSLRPWFRTVARWAARPGTKARCRSNRASRAWTA